MPTFETFNLFNDSLMLSYQRGNFQDSYDFLTDIAPQQTWFGEHEQQILYLRSCMAARLNNIERSLDLLEQALNKGYWFSDTVIRHSPSWTVLQGNARFEALATRSIALHAIAAENSQPILLVTLPDTATEPYRPLIVLHGNGDNGMLALEGWKHLAEDGWLVASFQSGQVAAVNAYVWNDQEWAIRDIKRLFSELQAQYDLDMDTCVIAGFSMGGETALHLGLTQALPVKRFVLLGPGGPMVDQPATLEPLLSDPPPLTIAIIIGNADVAIEPQAIRELTELLNSHGIATQLTEIPGLTHDYPQDKTILRNAVSQLA